MEVVLIIPGPWENHQQVVLDIIEASQGEYIFAGGILMNAQAKTHFELEVFEKTSNITNAFYAAAKSTPLDITTGPRPRP